MQIPVDSITVPERVRKDPGNLDSLMESLKRVGQLNPILVTPTYELIAGYRRLTAAQELGWQSVEVVVVQAADEVRRLEMELEENVYRKDFTPEEILEGYKKLEKLRHPSVGRRLAGTGVAMGVVPLGSGNGLARHFGQSLDPAESVEQLAAGAPCDIDVGVAGGVPFLVSASVAWDAALVEAYDAIGYAVRMPVTAVAGWPDGVAVPLDPAWSETYAASARRLCADGADAQLAELFVRAAWSAPPEGAAEVLRARSAAEAFLFRRFETLPAARGRFALNAALPIPFRGGAALEVDLLCRDARLAVELDGARHLSEESYRRDREKDLALQRHGWLVLRLLASDATARLGDVLDAILPLLPPATSGARE